MASKRHFSISKAVLDQISDSGSDTEPLAEMSDSDSWQDSSSDSDTDQRSGDSDNSAPDLSDVRTWCPIDCGMDEMTSLKRLSRRQIATTSSNPQLCFLGLILLTGVVGKPLQKWYWTTNKLLATPFFGTIMSECRFSLIMKNLHFTNNEEFDEATHPAPKLKKIWEVYQMIPKNFQQSYVPDRDISIDESLMAYKGRLSWIQFIASKRARFGIKSYMLSNAIEKQSGDKYRLYFAKTKLRNKESHHSQSAGVKFWAALCFGDTKITLRVGKVGTGDFYQEPKTQPCGQESKGRIQNPDRKRNLVSKAKGLQKVRISKESPGNG
ncbi:uncharacterized protein PAF06_018220 [Gastrophryne carolinensis]